MIPFLANMTIYLQGFIEKENASFAKDSAKAMLREMKKRFPGSGYLGGDLLGVGVYLYVLAFFVHPYNILQGKSVEENFNEGIQHEVRR
jgi:hypothetical protein